METQEKIVDVNVDGTFVVKTDAGELCRLCANTDNQFIPIFQGEGLEHNLSLKIERHLPIIKVTETDKLPLQICYQCASTLISWHNLYESCRVADKRLREIIAVDEKLYQEDDSCGDFADDFRDDYDDDTPVHLPTETPSTSNLESNAFKDNPTEIPTLSETKSLINETELEESDERIVSRDTRTIEEDPIHIPHNELSINLLDEPSTSIRNDLETMTADEYVCDVCGDTFLNDDSLLQHKKTHRQDEEPSADKTHEEYFVNEDGDLVNITESESSSTAAHLSTPRLEPYMYKSNAPYICKNSNGKFDCNICYMSFPLKSNVREHYYRVHCGKELSQCPQCEFASYSKSRLDVHLIKCHTKRFACERCGKMFPYQYQLTTHINGVHLNIRSHTCDTCGKSFKTKANFDTHIARHKDVRNFPCPHCNHRSRTSNDLAVHVRKHTGEKPFTCDVCGKAFAHNVNRIKHQRNVHGVSRVVDLSEVQGRQSSTRGAGRVKSRRAARKKPLTVDLDGTTFQFPDNELVDG